MQLACAGSIGTPDRFHAAHAAVPAPACTTSGSKAASMQTPSKDGETGLGSTTDDAGAAPVGDTGLSLDARGGWGSSSLIAAVAAGYIPS